MVFFAFQIYCDFGGYTVIARGAAQIMGISLLENFRQPYLAVSIRDFWKRWHISLTSWFTQYLNIPLGGNRRGIAHKWINIAIVFLVSGLWHGASWHYIVWGGLHALFQIIEDAKRQADIRTSNENKRTGRLRNVASIVRTFIIVDFAWLFFAAHGTLHAIKIVKRLFSMSPFVGLMNILYGTEDWIILIVALLTVFCVDICHERKLAIREITARWILPIRWGCISGLYG